MSSPSSQVSGGTNHSSMRSNSGAVPPFRRWKEYSPHTLPSIYQIAGVKLEIACLVFLRSFVPPLSFFLLS